MGRRVIKLRAERAGPIPAEFQVVVGDAVVIKRECKIEVALRWPADQGIGPKHVAVGCVDRAAADAVAAFAFAGDTRPTAAAKAGKRYRRVTCNYACPHFAAVPTAPFFGGNIDSRRPASL